MEQAEELLRTWLMISSKIRTHRYVENMTYNEALILGILNYQRTVSMIPYVQLKDLCEKTQMLKSAINRIVNNLVEKGYVERIKLDSNKKAVYIKMTDLAITEYELEHQKGLAIASVVIREMGEQKSNQIISLLKEATEIFENKCINEQRR